MRKCPDCKNEFVQPFVCTTCGAQKLYDTTVVTLQNQLAAAQAEIATLRVNAEKWRSYEMSKNQANKECGK